MTVQPQQLFIEVGLMTAPPPPGAASDKSNKALTPSWLWLWQRRGPGG